jgi:hypothetical protein
MKNKKNRMAKIVKFCFAFLIALSLVVIPVLAQNKQQLHNQADILIKRADALLAQTIEGGPDAASAGSSYWYLWAIGIAIALYVIYMLVQHARYRWFHGMDTTAVDARITSLLQLAQQRLNSIQTILAPNALNAQELAVWQQTVGTVIRRWSGTTGIMRWPVRSPLIRRIVRNGFDRRDATGNLIFVPSLQDTPGAGATPPNPARSRFYEDVEVCLAAILIAQQLLRKEISMYMYPRILTVNRWERRLQGRHISPIVHANNTVTFTYDTMLGAPGVTGVNVILPATPTGLQTFPMAQSADGRIFQTTIAIPPRIVAANRLYYFRVNRGGAGVNEFDPLNFNRVAPPGRRAAPGPAGGGNRF